MGCVADAIKHVVWHECETPKVVGEQFAVEFDRHFPPPFVEMFPEPLVVLGGFVWFHSRSTWLGFPLF